MSDDLTTFRDHCARMAKARHKPECPGWVCTCEPTRYGVHRREACPGCVTDANRALWARLAAEVDDYLTPAAEEGLFA